MSEELQARAKAGANRVTDSFAEAPETADVGCAAPGTLAGTGDDGAADETDGEAAAGVGLAVTSGA